MNDKDDNQKRVDDVARHGNELLKDNQLPKSKQGEVKKDIQEIQDSWKSTLTRGEKLHTVITRYAFIDMRVKQIATECNSLQECQ